MSDHYQILGVAKSATEDEIRRAYRLLAKRFHPDNGGDEEKFQRICDAYEAVKRDIYRYHNMLGVTKNAPESEIIKAYNEMSMHLARELEEGDRTAREKQNMLKEAFDILMGRKKQEKAPAESEW